MKQVHFKRIISMLVTVAMLVTMVPAVFANASQFVDFPTGWSKEAMTFSVDNGLINGKSATKIEPQANLTRAEMATIINRAFGSEVVCDISSYTDVKPNDWFYTEMQKAVNMQTFQGDGNGKLRPNDFITREEVMTVLARAIVLETADYSPLNRFSDNASVSDWAKPYVTSLVAGGYVDGYEDGTVRPGDKITREEFAQLMYNIFKTYFTKSGTYNKVTMSDCVMINEGGVTLTDVVIDGDLVLGDGVSTGGEIFLTNVTIKGRLVARGGVITLKNVTTGGGVVVKNVNGVTHFNNYKTEPVFKNVIEHTLTTYLTKGGAGGGGGGGGGGGSDDEEEDEFIIEVYTNLQKSEGSSDYELVYSRAKVNKGHKYTIDVKWTYGGVDYIFNSAYYVVDGKQTPLSVDNRTVTVNADTKIYIYYDLIGDETYTITFYMYPEGTAGCTEVGKLEKVNGVLGNEDDNTISNKVKNVYRNATPGRELWDSSVPTQLDVMYNHVAKGYVDGTYIHYIYPDLIYKTSEGKWDVFTGSTIINSDMNVYAVTKYAAIELAGSLLDYDFDSLKPVLSTPYSSTTRTMDSLKDAMYLSRTSFETVLTDELKQKILSKVAPKAKIIDENGYFLIKDYALKITDVISVGNIEKEIRNYLIDILENGTEEEIKEIVNMVSIDAMIDSIGISALANIVGYDVIKVEILKAENRQMLIEYIQSQLASDDASFRNSLLANAKFIETILANSIIKSKIIDSIIANPDIAINVLSTSNANKVTFIDKAIKNAPFVNSLLDNTVFRGKIINLIHNQDKQALIKLIDEDAAVRDAIIAQLRSYDATHNHIIGDYLEADVLFKNKIIAKINNKDNYKTLVTALKDYAYFKNNAISKISTKLGTTVTDVDYYDAINDYDPYVDDADGINAEITSYIVDIFVNYEASETTGINGDINSYINGVIDDYIENGGKKEVQFETQLDESVIVVVTEYLDNAITDEDVVDIIDEIIINYIKKHINLTDDEWTQNGDAKLKEFITNLKSHFVDSVKNTKLDDNLKSVIRTFISAKANKNIVTTLFNDYYSEIKTYIQSNATNDPVLNTQLHTVIKGEAKTTDTYNLLNVYINDNFDYIENELITLDRVKEYVEKEQGNPDFIALVKKKITSDTIVEYVLDVRKGSDKLEVFVSDAIDMLKKLDFYKKFINCFKNKNATYNINQDNIHFMMAVAQAIYSYDVDGALGLLNNGALNNLINKVPQIKTTVDELFTNAKTDFLNGVEDIKDKIDNDSTYNEDYAMSLGMELNIAKMLELYYDKAQQELVEKLQTKAPYYYDNNQYLREFLEMNAFDMMISYDASKDESSVCGTNSGYYIKDFMDYYDTAYNNLVLFDKAILWYGGHGHTPAITPEEVAQIRKDILDDFISGIDKLQSFLENLDSGDAIVGSYTVKDIIAKVESLKNLSGDAVGSKVPQITTIIDNVCTILEKIDGGEVVAAGYTMDELASLTDKLSLAVEKLSKEEYDAINKELSSAIEKAVTKAEEIINELGENGTILGKVSLDELFGKVDFINNIYLKYESKIDSLINKLASSGTIGNAGGAVQDKIDSEYWEDIVFGNDDYDRFNLDDVFDYAAPHLDGIRVESPDNWYDANAGGNKRFVVDEYSVKGGNTKVTIDRYMR